MEPILLWCIGDIIAPRGLDYSAFGGLLASELYTRWLEFEPQPRCLLLRFHHIQREMKIMRYVYANNELKGREREREREREGEREGES